MCVFVCWYFFISLKTFLFLESVRIYIFVYGKQIFHHQTDFIAVNMRAASVNVCQSTYCASFVILKMWLFTRLHTSPNHFLLNLVIYV